MAIASVQRIGLYKDELHGHKFDCTTHDMLAWKPCLSFRFRLGSTPSILDNRSQVPESPSRSVRPPSNDGGPSLEANHGRTILIVVMSR